METGLLKAEMVSKPGGGRHWDFAAAQAERARLLKALHTKGATLSQLAAPTSRLTPARRS
jgi:hypothetical protein